MSSLHCVLLLASLYHFKLVWFLPYFCVCVFILVPLLVLYVFVTLMCPFMIHPVVILCLRGVILDLVMLLSLSLWSLFMLEAFFFWSLWMFLCLCLCFYLVSHSLQTEAFWTMNQCLPHPVIHSSCLNIKT